MEKPLYKGKPTTKYVLALSRRLVPFSHSIRLSNFLCHRFKQQKYFSYMKLLSRGLNCLILCILTDAYKRLYIVTLIYLSNGH